MGERGDQFGDSHNPSHHGGRPSHMPTWRRKEHNNYPSRWDVQKATRGKRAVYLDSLRSAVDQPLDQYRPTAHRSDSHAPVNRSLNARTIECNLDHQRSGRPRADTNEKSPTAPSKPSAFATSPYVRGRSAPQSTPRASKPSSAPRSSRTIIPTVSKAILEGATGRAPVKSCPPQRPSIAPQEDTPDRDGLGSREAGSATIKSQIPSVVGRDRVEDEGTLKGIAQTAEDTSSKAPREGEWKSAPLALAAPDWRHKSPVLVSSDSSSREPLVPTTEVDFARLSGNLSAPIAPPGDPNVSPARAEMTKKRILPIRRKPPVEVTSLLSPAATSKMEAIDLTGSPLLHKTEETSSPSTTARANAQPPAVSPGHTSPRMSPAVADAVPTATVHAATPARLLPEGESEMEISQDGQSAERNGVEKRQRPSTPSDSARKKHRIENTEDLLDLDQVDCGPPNRPLDFDAVFNAHMNRHTRRLVGTANDGRPLTEEDLCIRWTAGAVDLLDFRDYLLYRQDEFIAEFGNLQQNAAVPAISGRPLARISVEDCERLHNCVRSLAEDGLRNAERIMHQRGRLRGLAKHVCAQLRVNLDHELTDSPVSGGSERQQLARDASSYELVIQPDIGVYLVNAVDEKSRRREIKRGELTLPYRFKTVKAHNDSLVAHALLCNISWLCSRPITITAASYSREYLIPGLRGPLNARKLIQWLNGESWGCHISFTAIGRRKILRSEVSSDSEG